MRNRLLVLFCICAAGALTTCSKPQDPPAPIPPQPLLSAINPCGAERIPDTLIVMGKAVSTKCKVAYIAQNDLAYGTMSINSEGVMGLVATLLPGKLAGQGNTGDLVFRITGTAQSGGKAGFKFNFGGISCSFYVTVITQEEYDCKYTTPEASLVCRTKSFIASLTDAQRSALLLPYTNANASQWSAERPPCTGCHIGLLIRGDTLFANTFFSDMIKAASDNVASAQLNFLTLINARLSAYDPQPGPFKYGMVWVAILGTPSLAGTWQLQVSGHNIAYNYTMVNGKLFHTPVLRGTEPTNSGPVTVDGFYYYDYFPMVPDSASIKLMLESLTPAQQAAARLSAPVNGLLMGGPASDGNFPVLKQGIAVSSLNSNQQTYVKSTIGRVAKIIMGTTAAFDEKMAVYNAELNDTYLAYYDNIKMDAPGSYLRFDGPSVWIEVYRKNGVFLTGQLQTYILWRDKKKDYGGR